MADRGPMTGAGQRAADWLGLRGGAEEARREGRVPPWHGASPRRRAVAVAVWLAVGLAVFLVLSARVPEQDGLGGFLPLWGATGVTALGVALTERSSLRLPPRR